MAWQSAHNIPGDLPLFLVTALAYLQGQMRTEGLFRIACTAVVLAECEKALDKGKCCLLYFFCTNAHPHCNALRLTRSSSSVLI